MHSDGLDNQVHSENVENNADIDDNRPLFADKIWHADSNYLSD